MGNDNNKRLEAENLLLFMIGIPCFRYFVLVCAQHGSQTLANSLRNDVDKLVQRNADFKNSELLLVVSQKPG